MFRQQSVRWNDIAIEKENVFQKDFTGERSVAGKIIWIMFFTEFTGEQTRLVGSPPI